MQVRLMSIRIPFVKEESIEEYSINLNTFIFDVFIQFRQLNNKCQMTSEFIYFMLIPRVLGNSPVWKLNKNFKQNKRFVIVCVFEIHNSFETLFKLSGKFDG